MAVSGVSQPIRINAAAALSMIAKRLIDIKLKGLTLRFSGERFPATSKSKCYQNNARPSPLQALRWMSSSNLSGPQQRLLDSARQFDEDKIVFWVEVVFAAFIDNSDIAIHCSVLVRQDTIDFVKLREAG